MQVTFFLLWLINFLKSFQQGTSLNALHIYTDYIVHYTVPGKYVDPLKDHPEVCKAELSFTEAILSLLNRSLLVRSELILIFIMNL